MKWFSKDAILSSIDPDQALAAIAQAFQDHSSGKVQALAAGHLRFDQPSGDVHVKGAHVDGRPLFAVKVASSFYDNPRRGLPSSNGLMVVFDGHTGVPLGVLSDEGALTDLRTAMAGAIAAKLIAPATPRRLGVVGAGTQAALQARGIARAIGVDAVTIWARSPQSADDLARTLAAEGVKTTTSTELSALCLESDLIVTTTPARSPLLGPEHLRPGLRIIAVGADSVGKRELAPELVGAADLVLVDSRQQCAAYGDSADALPADRMIEIGEALAAGEPPTLAPRTIAIADLTGLGAQDAAIAELAWRSLTRT